MKAIELRGPDNTRYYVRVERVKGIYVFAHVFIATVNNLSVYNEGYCFVNDTIAIDFCNEFTKRQANQVLTRYLRYKLLTPKTVGAGK